MSGPHAKRIKTMDCIKRKEEEEKASDRLPWEDLLPQILAFVGDRHYRFVGAVNHSFHVAYVALFPSKETDVNVSSNALAELCMNDCAEMWDTYYKTHKSTVEDGFFSEMDGSGMAMSVLHTAAMYNLEVLKHLRTLPLKSKFMEVIWSSYLISSHAAGAGQLHIVQWLREQNIPCDSGTCTAAADSGHLEILQWCHTHGVEWDEDTFGAAADGGHWPVLNYLYDNGCPWDSFTCSKAAAEGRLEVLQWLRSKGCPWCPQTPSFAAYYGHFDVLKWAYYNNCPVDYDTCISAHRGKHWEILEWARNSGFPVDQDFFAWSFIDDDDDEESEIDDFSYDDS